MTTVRRHRRALEGPGPEFRLLRFADGLIADPDGCQRRIHARSHWLLNGVCRCTPEPAVASSPSETNETNTSCHRSGGDDGPTGSGPPGQGPLPEPAGRPNLDRATP